MRIWFSFLVEQWMWFSPPGASPLDVASLWIWFPSRRHAENMIAAWIWFSDGRPVAAHARVADDLRDPWSE